MGDAGPGAEEIVRQSHWSAANAKKRKAATSRRTPKKKAVNHYLADGLLPKAEGTRFELATPYGAPHFQADADCPDSRGKQQGAGVVRANAGAVELNAQNIDDDLQAVIDAWSRLPDAVRTAIRVIIQNV